jgi:tetratricopeptide (TPR) repeat protein
VIEHHPDPDKSARRAQNLELLKLCVEESPEYFYASRQLGLEYVLREEWNEAIPHLETYVRQPADAADAPFERAASRMQLAKCLARVGDWGRAVDEFSKAAEEAPKRREPLYWAAIEFIMAGHPLDAIPWLERCLKVPPDDMPEFSLYSKEVQRDLPATTLLDCQTMADEARAKYEAQRGRVG